MGWIIGAGDQTIRLIDHFENAYQTQSDYTLDKTSEMAAPQFGHNGFLHIQATANGSATLLADITRFLR